MLVAARLAGSLFSHCRPRCPAAVSLLRSPTVRMASTPSFAVPTIQLDSQESAVLDLIDNFTKHLASTRHDLPSVECRVAGGWVRDKVCPYAT